MKSLVRVSLFLPLVLVACGQGGPSPTMGPEEIGTEVANTLVAEAAAISVPTGTPEPSKTTQPTDTYTPRPTATPRPTSTSRPPTPTPRPPTATPTGCPQGCTYPPPGCVFKGNISVNTGEKIYHVPGQQYYNDTIISPEKGERWFCTDEEAIRNGWRKSKV